MEDPNKGNQPANGNDGDPSGQGGQQYSDNERQLYARAKTAEQKVKDLEQALKDKAGNGDGNGGQGSDDAWKERMELIARGITDEADLNFIMQNGGKKALDNDFVKRALNSKKEERDAEAKAAFDVGAKSVVEKQYTPEQIKAMSAKEYGDLISGRKR